MIDVDDIEKIMNNLPDANKFTRCIWMNETTVKSLKEMTTAQSSNGIERFCGIEVKIDNSIPDYHFETDADRNERFNYEVKNRMEFFPKTPKYFKL